METPLGALLSQEKKRQAISYREIARRGSVDIEKLRYYLPSGRWPGDTMIDKRTPAGDRRASALLWLRSPGRRLQVRCRTSYRPIKRRAGRHA